MLGYFKSLLEALFYPLLLLTNWFNFSYKCIHIDNHSRVKLMVHNDDYINASYIHVSIIRILKQSIYRENLYKVTALKYTYSI